MSYAKVLVTLPNEQYDVWNIQSQAQLELGRKLNTAEENMLKNKYSAKQLSSEINKVCYHI